jgi:tetratricopeptide (TPR) repeat protein
MLQSARIWLAALVSATSLFTSVPVRAAQYAIDGFAIGQPVASGNPNYRSYSCKPSEQFADALDCERTQQKNIGGHAVTVSNTLIHTRDGVAIYEIMDVAPSSVSNAAVQNEIGELTRAIGEKPASANRQEMGRDVTTVITATWGAVALEDVQGYDLDMLAAGGNLRLGMAFDPLGDTKASADQYLPISRLAGGLGYVYSASFDKQGRVRRRYIAIDPKQVAVRQFRLSLQNILRKDSALPGDDYHLWPDIAWIARNLARDTSVSTTLDLLDAGFEQNHSTKLRSHIWALLPFGAIRRLAAGEYSRIDIYSPTTQHPEVRRDIENFVAQHSSDRFVEFAYYLLGEYEKALQVSPDSPISSVLHYGIGYKHLEALMQDALHVLKTRITPATPTEVQVMLDPLLGESPDTDDHVNGALRVANASWKASDRQPLASMLPSFSKLAASAQSQFASVMAHPTSPIADDAAYLSGWLYLQSGKTDEALTSFSRAMVIGNGDYKPAAIWETLRIMEKRSPAEQLAMVSGDQAFAQQPQLWYEAARSAYRDFDYPLTIEVAKQALHALNIPFDDLPVTSDSDRITAAIQKINPQLSDNVNVTELPYLIEASKEMSEYEVYLGNAGKESPDVLWDHSRKIILKYSMLIDPPEPTPGTPKPPPVHKDLRQALHLIDLTLQAVPKEPAYAKLREWLRFRTVRVMVLFAPERVPQAIAALAEEFPGSKLLDDAMAEQVFAEGVIMNDPDAAQKTFNELLRRYPNGNAVDNAYSWMAIIMRCANRLDDEKRLNAEIIRRFPLTRHAKYARERMANLDACGLSR